jgi:acyl-CoA dehydrogenase
MTERNPFRAEARAWLEENCPAEMREPVRDEGDTCWGGRNFVFKSDAQRLWLERCAAKGYTVPDWSKAYGGGWQRRNGNDVRLFETAHAIRSADR